jgi:hypothetical protein
MAAPVCPADAQQLHEAPAQLATVEHGTHECPSHTLPRSQSSDTLHWSQVWLAGSHFRLPAQSLSMRHCTQVSCALRFMQKGVSPPHGEQLGPQKIAESQGAQSAASLQW